ncbi:hypothetical protein T07_12346 [Trichinella nelsoni]|uniref:Uncharacterized protein n=1 Tax=Trichinella nelsoni TaxID=6336 RepID=A0A0V0S9F4_9BILA|nr:hypothetical protein T07_12346 [Trichinella nelsoni]
MLNQSLVKVDASWPQQRRLFLVASHLMLMLLCERNDDRCHRTSSVLWRISRSSETASHCRQHQLSTLTNITQPPPFTTVVAATNSC